MDACNTLSCRSSLNISSWVVQNHGTVQYGRYEILPVERRPTVHSTLTTLISMLIALHEYREVVGQRILRYKKCDKCVVEAEFQPILYFYQISGIVAKLALLTCLLTPSPAPLVALG